MKITYKFGDMFASFEMVLVHGCNKAGGFNSGVAGVMRKQYPDAYKGYMTAYHNQELELGHIVWVTAPDGRLIGNAITQEKYGRDPKIVYASYEGIRKAIRNVNEMVAGVHKTVGLPLIGAGLANGDWEVISKIIEEEAVDFEPVVYVIDEKVFEALALDYGSANLI